MTFFRCVVFSSLICTSSRNVPFFCNYDILRILPGSCAFLISSVRRIVRIGYVCILVSDCSVFSWVFRNWIYQTIFVCIVVLECVVSLYHRLSCLTRLVYRTYTRVSSPYLSRWSCRSFVFSSSIHNHPLIFQSEMKILRRLVLRGLHLLLVEFVFKRLWLFHFSLLRFRKNRLDCETCYVLE